MRRTVSIAVALLTAMLLIQTTARAQTESSNGSLSGTWMGTWQTGAAMGPLVLRLMQKDEIVAGTYDAAGGPAGLLQGVRVYGTLKDDHLVLLSGDSQRAFDGRVQGNTIMGTYRGKRSVKHFIVTRSDKRE